MNDVNDMDSANENLHEPLGTVEKAARPGIDRRTMLKAAVATGTVAAVWVAPRIESFGFAPAFAATMCTVTNDVNDDLQTNQSGNTYVSPGFTGCGESLGSSGNNAPDTITLNNPTTTCTSGDRQPANCTPLAPTSSVACVRPKSASPDATKRTTSLPVFDRTPFSVI